MSTADPAGAAGRGAWRVPFMRPDVPGYEALAGELAASLRSGVLTKGAALERFEREANAVVGTSQSVAVSSCTVGLMLVLRSLTAVARLRQDGCPRENGCAPGGPGHVSGVCDEVILPSFIFLAAPAAVVWAGLRPVFVDVDPETFTIDPQRVAAALSPRTAAILACHTFGCPCDMESLLALATRADVPLVVDAAHGFGAARGGRQVGHGGLAQVFSLSPTKLVVAGEGGLVATSCACLADLVRAGREYGNDGAYGCTHAGLNGRMPEMSAILGRASLQRLDDVARRRRAAAAAYISALAGLPGIGFQRIPAGCHSSWKDFSISIDEQASGISRDGLRVALAERGIDTRAYYSPPCHEMTAFRPFAAAAGSLPVTDRLAASLVALPMGAHVSGDVAREVAAAIRDALPITRRSVYA